MTAYGTRGPAYGTYSGTRYTTPSYGVYRKKINDLQGALAAEKTPEIAEAIRALVGEIRLVPIHGRLALEVTGNLAGILSLASDKRVRPVGPFGPDREIVELSDKIKLVAGTRTHRDLTAVVCV